MDAIAAYAELQKRGRDVATLQGLQSLLSWDEETYMPRGGTENRGEQAALVGGLVAERLAAKPFADLLDHVEASALVRDPDGDVAANVREWRRQHQRYSRLPRALVEELKRTSAHAQHAWVDARNARSFSMFLPWLEKLVALKREEARCLMTALDATEPYDALLDEHEPGARTADLEMMFSSLTSSLVPLVQRIVAAPKKPDRSLLSRGFDMERQRVLAEIVASAVGFDFGHGRLDTTTHPFCITVGSGDVRITTRFSDDVSDGFFGTLHEAGHGLYEQGLPRDAVGTACGSVLSLGLHESQSRLWENLVGRSEAFWRSFFPLFQRMFPAAMHGVGFEDWLRANNDVAPSPVRVRADEVTYNLHVVIRFEIERALIAGALEARDIEVAWNAAYERLLGIKPPDAKEGCLQDVHWSAGLFGYFPTYTLGNLYSAQLFEAAQRDVPGLLLAIEKGHFAPLTAWLRDKVHRHGGRYPAKKLVELATGAPPTADAFLRHLKKKAQFVFGVG